MLQLKVHKKFLTIFLVFVFFSPSLIKAVHLIDADHQHEFVLNSKNVEINESHNDCPICEFHFTQLITTENYYETLQVLIVSDFTPFFKTTILKNTLAFSFNLRAPPVTL